MRNIRPDCYRKIASIGLAVAVVVLPACLSGRQAWAGFVGARTAADSLDFKTTIARVTPSVVRVYAKRVLRRGNRRIQLLGQASGVLLSSDGWVVTQNSIIGDVNLVHVRSADDVPIPAKVVLRDSSSGLAFLKVDLTTTLSAGQAGLPREAGVLKPVTMGNSDLVRPGHGVLHVGNPFGLARGKNARLSVNHGVVTSVHVPDVPGQGYKGKVIHTDAGFNPGGYGGALVNLKGELIGVAVAVKTSRRTNTEISFAIPVNEVKKLLADARRKAARPVASATKPKPESTKRPDIDHPMRQAGVVPGYLGAYMLDESTGTRGAYIDRVIPGSPADVAGLRTEDLVVAADSKPLRNGNDLLKLLVGATEGQILKLTVERDGIRLEIEVKLGKVPRRVLR